MVVVMVMVMLHIRKINRATHYIKKPRAMLKLCFFVNIDTSHCKKNWLHISEKRLIIGLFLSVIISIFVVTKCTVPHQISFF